LFFYRLIRRKEMRIGRIDACCLGFPPGAVELNFEPSVAFLSIPTILVFIVASQLFASASGHTSPVS
jgi:hypothetical protein